MAQTPSETRPYLSNPRHEVAYLVGVLAGVRLQLIRLGGDTGSVDQALSPYSMTPGERERRMALLLEGEEEAVEVEVAPPRANGEWASAQYRNLFAVLDAAVNKFLHGDPCANDTCDERGFCHECVIKLEEAHDRLRRRLPVLTDWTNA